MESYRFEKLNEINHESRFVCEEDAFNTWLREKSLQSDRFGITQTYLLIGRYEADEPDRVLGFYSIKTVGIKLNGATTAAEVFNFNNQDFMPLAEIKYLARHLGGKGKDLGVVLLLDAFRKIVEASTIIGIAGIYLRSSTRRAAIRLYDDAGFEDFGDSNRYLPIEQAKAAIGQ